MKAVGMILAVIAYTWLVCRVYAWWTKPGDDGPDDDDQSYFDQLD